MARRWVGEGAEALHLVDLEGARSGNGQNLEWVLRIRHALPTFLQVGGGVRTVAQVERLLEAGLERVVIGTAAVEEPMLLAEMVARYGPERVAAALDLKAGCVAVKGWESQSERSVSEVTAGLRAAGIRWLVATDVTRDGTLAGPAFDLAAELIDAGFQVIMAGGIAKGEQIAKLRDLGAAGCVVGSALYKGVLTLAEALAAARGPSAG